MAVLPTPRPRRPSSPPSSERPCASVVGALLGEEVGTGAAVGPLEGISLAMGVGAADGAGTGAGVGGSDGNGTGAADGEIVGAAEGEALKSVGPGVGDSVMRKLKHWSEPLGGTRLM